MPIALRDSPPFGTKAPFKNDATDIRASKLPERGFELNPLNGRHTDFDNIYGPRDALEGMMPDAYPWKQTFTEAPPALDKRVERVPDSNVRWTVPEFALPGCNPGKTAIPTPEMFTIMVLINGQVVLPKSVCRALRWEAQPGMECADALHLGAAATG